MRSRVLRFCAGVVLACGGQVLSAQDAGLATHKAPVAVHVDGEDAIGARLGFSVREAVRRSAAFELVSFDASVFRIHLVTLNPDPDGAAASRTVASVTFAMANLLPTDKTKPQTWYPIFLRSIVVTSGARVTDQTALDIVATLDEEIERYKRNMDRY
jgi:hypothetical protein